MKTKEFIKWLEDNKIPFKEYDSVIEVVDIARLLKYDIGIKLFDITLLHLSQIKTLEKIIEYAQTPLEEREEEKKYMLKFPKEFNILGLYVIKNNSIENYFTKAFDFEDYKYAFTQKEIDAMPFDTNFFIKVEVNDK